MSDPARAPLSQAVLLGDIADLGHLDIVCTRCDRHGRQRIARLIKQYGADMQMPQLALFLSADCPRSTSTDPSTRCFVCFPQLVTRAGLSSADAQPATGPL